MWAPSGDLDSCKVIGQRCQSSVSQTRKGWDPSANLTPAREPTMPSQRCEPEGRGVGCLAVTVWVTAPTPHLRKARGERRGLPCGHRLGDCTDSSCVRARGERRGLPWDPYLGAHRLLVSVPLW